MEVRQAKVSFRITKLSTNSQKLPIILIIQGQSFSGDQGSKKMLKKWKQIFAIAMVLGWSAGAALAGKLTIEGPVSKPIGDPPQETLTVDPQPVADSTPFDGPLLHTRSMEELPMPKS